jgi:intergrase/recombinase
MHGDSWRIMIQVILREVVRFIYPKFEELKISEARYEDLLSEDDKHYSKYPEKLVQFVYASHMQKPCE